MRGLRGWRFAGLGWGFARLAVGAVCGWTVGGVGVLRLGLWVSRFKLKLTSWRLQLTTLTFNLPFRDAKQAGSLVYYTI